MQYSNIKNTVKNWIKSHPKKSLILSVFVIVGVINIFIHLINVIYTKGIWDGVNIANLKKEEKQNSTINIENSQGLLSISSKKPITKIKSLSTNNGSTSTIDFNKISAWKISDFSNKPNQKQLKIINSIKLNKKLNSLIENELPKNKKVIYKQINSKTWAEISKAINQTLIEKSLSGTKEISQNQIKLEKKEQKKLFLISLALSWASAHSGNISSMYDLALGLSTADHYQLENDYSTSLIFLKKAAKAGHPPAQSLIGLLLIKGGNGVMINKRKGLSWLKLAVENNSFNAMCELGTLYLSGSNGIKQNQEEGIKLLKNGLLKQYFLGDGYSSCAKPLRRAYREGQGVQQNCEKSLRLSALTSTNNAYFMDLQNLNVDVLDHLPFSMRANRINFINRVYTELKFLDTCEKNRGKIIQKWTKSHSTIMNPSTSESNCLNQKKPKKLECPEGFRPIVSCNKKQFLYPAGGLKEKHLDKFSALTDLLSNNETNNYSWRSLCYFIKDPELAYAPKSKYKYELKTNLPSHVISNIEKLSIIRKK